MIIENYLYYCLRGLVRVPAPGNPRARKQDLFRPRIGTPLSTARPYESWATDLYTIKLTGADIGTGQPIMFRTMFGIGRWLSNRVSLGIRAGSVEEPITTFENTNFSVFFNGIEKFNMLGWFNGPEDFDWRLEGGERLYLRIFDGVGIAMADEDFIYVDLKVHNDPQKFILDKETGDVKLGLLQNARQGNGN